MPVGRDHQVEAARALVDQGTQAVRVVGGVDQQLGAVGAGGQQVGVVVHRADGGLPDLEHVGVPVQSGTAGQDVPAGGAT